MARAPVKKLTKKWKNALENIKPITIKFDNKSPIVNKARCTICGDIIESKSVHDFVKCKCGRIFVDGGHDYQRTGFKKPTDIEIWNGQEKKFKPLVSE